MQADVLEEGRLVSLLQYLLLLTAVFLQKIREHVGDDTTGSNHGETCFRNNGNNDAMWRMCEYCGNQLPALSICTIVFLF